MPLQLQLLLAAHNTDVRAQQHEQLAICSDNSKTASPRHAWLYCRCIQYLQWYTSDSRTMRAGASTTTSSSKTGVAVPENSDWRLASLRGTFSDGKNSATTRVLHARRVGAVGQVEGCGWVG